MGERFGNYEILRRLAAGGMAEVLLAKQRSFGGFERLVCLKRILPHLRRQEDFLKMFQDEARIAANLTHPNVAQIYDIAQQQDATYIAMEYVRGEDLRRIYNQEVSRSSTIAQPIAALIAMGVAAGLDYAHRHSTLEGTPLNIVHRDISPQNILVSYDGFVKIIDFGVAKAAGKLIVTRSGVLKGKYSYMSPEQASGDPVDGRTDIFALGITLYEITTGVRLFKRDNELETLHAVIACNVKPPRELVPNYPRELEEIILKALAYNPDGRYSTAGEMERDLEHFLKANGHPTSAGHLATYMHDVFAEKLADEALFGGPPWSEAQTDSKALQAAKKAAEHTRTEALEHHEDTRIDAPLEDERPAAAATDMRKKATTATLNQDRGLGNQADWGTQSAPLEQTQGGWAPSSVGQPPTTSGTHTIPVPPPAPEDEAAPPTSPPAAAEAPQPDHASSLATSLAEGLADPWLRSSWAKRRRAVVAAVAALAIVVGAGSWWKVKSRRASPLSAVGAKRATARQPAALGQLPIQPIAADDAEGYLYVNAAIPMAVSLKGRYLGDTPLVHLPTAPGDYQLRLENRPEGVTIARQVHVLAGHAAQVEVAGERGTLQVSARPWAWVQIGEYPGEETPLQVDLLAGEYTLHLECPDGRTSVQVVKVAKGNIASTQVACP